MDFSTPGREDANYVTKAVSSSQDMAPAQVSETSQSANIGQNEVMEEAFSNLANYLPQGFNDLLGAGEPYAMSDLMDNFATGDLFW